MVSTSLEELDFEGEEVSDGCQTPERAILSKGDGVTLSAAKGTMPAFGSFASLRMTDPFYRYPAAWSWNSSE